MIFWCISLQSFTLLHTPPCFSMLLHGPPPNATLLYSPTRSTTLHHASPHCSFVLQALQCTNILPHTPPCSSTVLHALQRSSTVLKLSIILIHVYVLSSTFIHTVENKTKTYYLLGYKSNCWISRYQCSDGQKHIERKNALWICWGRTIWA